MKKTELEIIREVKSKWIWFRIVKRLPKTVVIEVIENEDGKGESGAILGEIYWFPRWRCYCFEPFGGTIYEKVCMRDIANLLELLTQNQRIK